MCGHSPKKMKNFCSVACQYSVWGGTCMINLRLILFSLRRHHGAKGGAVLAARTFKEWAQSRASGNLSLWSIYWEWPRGADTNISIQAMAKSGLFLLQDQQTQALMAYSQDKLQLCFWKASPQWGGICMLLSNQSKLLSTTSPTWGRMSAEYRCGAGSVGPEASSDMNLRKESLRPSLPSLMFPQLCSDHIDLFGSHTKQFREQTKEKKSSSI